MSWPDVSCQSRNLDPLYPGRSTTSDLPLVNENFMSGTSSLPPPSMSDYHSSIEDHQNNDRLRTFPTSSFQKLAIVNVALYECAAKLPSMAKAGTSSADTGNNGQRSSRKATSFAIDELFRLTTEFIDVMKCLVERETSATSSSIDMTQPGARPSLSPIAYNQPLSYAGRPITPTSMALPSTSISHVDEATMFMVMSCHCCLTEIYLSMFEMMQACIEHSLAPQMDKDWAIVLPQLQIGSLASPPVHVDINVPLSSTMASMYMLMITMLSSKLWMEVADIMRAGGDVQTGFTPSPRCILTDTMWNAVTDKTDRLSQTIDDTKRLLRRSSAVLE